MGLGMFLRRIKGCFRFMRMVWCLGFFDFVGAPCRGFEEVIHRYNEITSFVQLSGPTSFAPLIRKTIDIVKEEQSV